MYEQAKMAFCAEYPGDQVCGGKVDPHDYLTAAGMVLDGADGINAIWYLAEGDWKNALISAIALIPLLGNITVVRKTAKGPNGGGTLSPGKGKLGVSATIDELKALGYTDINTEIKFVVDGVEFHADIIAKAPNSNRWTLVESKNGPNAKMEPNQAYGYDIIRTRGGTPYGDNARKAGLQEGIHMRPSQFDGVAVWWWNAP